MRKKTRVIKIGNRKIGGGNPVLVQSMCNTGTKEITATLNQIEKLEQAGCDIVRVAVPDIASTKALDHITKNVNIPVVADIHFDYQLAVESAKYADKIRINPGNIGSRERVAKIVDACKERDIPIRVGINSGSLSKGVVRRFGHTSRALFESAKEFATLLEGMNFEKLVFSLKSWDTRQTVEANRLFAHQFDYPLHIGVTEAGIPDIGLIKSSIGIGAMLLKGIGDTIRVSLTGDPVQEVQAGKTILKALGLRKGRRFVSCPTCARASRNFIPLADKIERATRDQDKDVKIAVMGCEVNGPGEAKDADLGVACSRGVGYIFKKGNIIKKVEEKGILNEFLKEYEKL